jgi:23S rRNA pseudoU1915 N3-methylase RlmH
VRIIALDERGKDLTSVGLSQQLEAGSRTGATWPS